MLETTVVQGDVPLLLPVRLLKALNVTIDLKGMYMKLQDHGVVVPLHEMPSGHVTVNIFSFSAGRFHVPPQAGRQEEFELENACFATTAMPAQREQGFQFDRVPKDAHRPPATHGVAPSKGKGSGGRSTFHGSNSDGSGAPCGQSSSSAAELEGGSRQDWHPPDFGGAPRRHRGLVFGLGLAALGAAVNGDHACRTTMPRRSSQPILCGLCRARTLRLHRQVHASTRRQA